METVTRPRVVFLPGAMGTVLTDSGLTPGEAREECERNLGPVGRRLLEGSALYPCDKDPASLWGTAGSLHWLFNPEAWQRRITAGNGRDDPGAARPGPVLDVDMRLRRKRIEFRPYAAFLKALRDAGADVLVVPYDWRLSNRQSAHLLQRRILEKWFGGHYLEQARRLREDERITFIGHSMGGLIARFFLESAHQGHVLARRLITIGTPHLGAPQAYLHLIGRTLPLPDNPFYREVRAAGIPPAAGATAQFVPAKIQTAVFRFMSSAFEILPVYDFVTSKGRTEPFAETYRAEVHAPTRRPAIRVIAELRQGLTDDSRLDEWLGVHDLEYHFLAATGFPTALGYDRGRDRIVTGREGDGTVPLRSAHVRPAGTARLRLHTLAPGAAGHQRLCERKDVQAYCLALLRATRPAVTASGVQRVPPETFVCVARSIMEHMAPYRGVVLSVVRLSARDGRPLIDPSTEPSPTSLRRRLTNPPRHLSSPEIHEVRSPRHGLFRYVWILSNERASFPVGGMLFVPAAGHPDAHLVTFNVGQLETRSRARCGNAHHAEMQFERWVREQPAAWRARLGTIHIGNYSRRTTMRGYSPCNPCCADLANLLTALRSSSGQVIDAEISWCTPYRGNRICGHPTDAANLQRLRASGWRLNDTCRSAVMRPPAATTKIPVTA
jgi:pimeloyl-ACP methyl ester carboxylesterase